jgi:carbon monoxide dehydrogenase subunit G
MVEIHVEQTIAAPVEKVFDWMADPANLAAAPLALKAGWAKGSSGPGAGAVRAVTGVGMSFREEITAYGEGTRVDWVSNYTHPVRAGGKLLEAVSYRLLRSSFGAILAACTKALEIQRV